MKTALDLVKKNSTAKFDESVDIALKINLKQSKGGDFSLRTIVNLPNGSGKKNKVAVLCEPDKIDEAKKAGADIVGSDDLLEKIAAGKFDFTKIHMHYSHDEQNWQTWKSFGSGFNAKS